SPKLSGLGFEPVACFTLENALANVTPYVQLWVNRKGGQIASANVSIAKGGGDRPPVIKTHLEFVTKIAGAGGHAIVTNNAEDLGAFARTGFSDTLGARRLKDPSQLYRLHVWRESQQADASAERFVPAPRDELNWFADVYEESIVRQLRTGLLRKDSGDVSVFVPTLLGAYRMTWAQQAPFKGLRRTAEDRRAEEMIRRCAAEKAPPAP